MTSDNTAAYANDNAVHDYSPDISGFLGHLTKLNRRADLKSLFGGRRILFPLGGSSFINGWNLSQVWEYPTLQILTKTDHLQEAMEAVARTIWVLWEETPDKVWEVLKDWSLEGNKTDLEGWILREACPNIVRIGLHQGHLDTNEALQKIDDWLLGDVRDLQEAAVRLVPPILLNMSYGDLTEVSSKWTTSGHAGHLRALSRAMVEIFSRDAIEGTKTLIKWARYENSGLDSVITDALSDVRLPSNESLSFYRSVDKLLILLMSSMKGRSQRVVRRIQKLINYERGLMSRHGTEDKLRPGGKRAKGKGR